MREESGGPISLTVSRISHDERRSDGPRITQRLDLWFGAGNQLSHRGLIHNMSKGGLGLFTRAVYPPGKIFNLTLIRPDGVQLPLQGEVRWTRLLPREGVTGEKYEMGVRVMEVSDAYSALFEQVRAEAEHEEDRAGDRGLIKVEFDSPRHAAHILNRHVETGAAWAFLKDKPSQDMVALVPVKLPGISDEMYALGRVSSVDTEPEGGHPPRVLLRFLRLFAGSGDPIAAKLDSAERDLGVARLTVLTSGLG